MRIYSISILMQHSDPATGAFSVRCILESSSHCPNILLTVPPSNNHVLRSSCRPPPGSSESIWEFFRVKHSIVLGVTTKKTYTGVSIELRPGDRLFLYTDGVTEAKNSNNELFGEARLREALDSMRGTPSELINELKMTLERFAAGEPQSDDISKVA